MKNVSYLSGTTPPEYRCAWCSAFGVKLWRMSNSSHVELLCYDCGKIEQGCGGSMPKSDQIGSLVPAIPDEEGISYWWYNSAPVLGCWWWWQLPPFPGGDRVIQTTKEKLPLLKERFPELYKASLEALELLRAKGEKVDEEKKCE